MSTRFIMTTGDSDQEHFYQRFEIERNITLQLAGMTEEDLTSDQRTALDAFIQAQKDFHFQKYGLSRPRGNSLRMESDAECATRLVWEEAIKPAHIKLEERVTAAALQYWQTHIDQDLENVHVQWTEERERSDEWELTETDQLFYMRIHNGYSRSYAIVEIWLAVHTDQAVDILQAACTGYHHNWQYFKPGTRVLLSDDDE